MVTESARLVHRFFWKSLLEGFFLRLFLLELNADAALDCCARAATNRNDGIAEDD